MQCIYNANYEYIVWKNDKTESAIQMESENKIWKERVKWEWKLVLTKTIKNVQK